MEARNQADLSREEMINEIVKLATTDGIPGLDADWWRNNCQRLSDSQLIERLEELRS